MTQVHRYIIRYVFLLSMQPENEHYGDADSLASVDLGPYMGLNDYNAIRNNGHAKTGYRRRIKSSERVVSSFIGTYFPKCRSRRCCTPNSRTDYFYLPLPNLFSICFVFPNLFFFICFTTISVRLLFKHWFIVQTL